MALLGAYHGLNPAMGWLFAVGLGLQERSRGAVLRALPPIAIGHELALALVAIVVVLLGLLADPRPLHIGAGVVLIAFGLFRFARPRAHPRWTKGRVSRRELALWSFLMASAHGAGLMIAPVLLGGSAPAAESHALDDLALGALALLLHVAAMLAVMAAVAVLVYDRLGVRILRTAWVNTDALWAGAFVLAGVITLFS
jgi:hypothetical protein